MKILFCFDKIYNKEHFKINHPDVTENEVLEIFGNTYVIFEEQRICKIVGHTNNKRYLVVVGVYGENGNAFRVITAYEATKKHLIYYKKEVMKNE